MTDESEEWDSLLIMQELAKILLDDVSVGYQTRRLILQYMQIMRCAKSLCDDKALYI